MMLPRDLLPTRTDPVPTFHLFAVIWPVSPGNDLESIAGQVAAGSNMILFTTGNGSVTNFPFVPTLKALTTTKRYELLRDDMDINAGAYLDQDVSQCTALSIPQPVKANPETFFLLFFTLSADDVGSVGRASYQPADSRLLWRVHQGRDCWPPPGNAQ